MSELYKRVGITPDDFRERYWTNGESMNSIAISLGLRRGDYLKPHIVREGIAIKSIERAYTDAASDGAMSKYNMNRGFFDKINAESAWVLGLIASDGYVLHNGKVFGVVSKDRSLLAKILALMGCDCPIKKHSSGRCLEISINSTRMVKALNRLGIANDKSLTLEMPPMGARFIGHFIRGYFDGDGCFSTQNTQHSTGLVKGSVGIATGSSSFADALMRLLKSNGMKPTMAVRDAGDVVFPSGVVSHRHKTYTVRLHGFSVARFYEFIYKNSDDATRLARKHSKFSSWYSKFGAAYANGRLNPTPSRAMKFNEAVNYG